MNDAIPKHGEELTIETKCARCGDVVKPNETHTCKEGTNDENSNSGQAPTK
jgi:uncharacterized OB-fold protein